MHAAAQPGLFGLDGPAAYWSLASLFVIAAGLLLGRLLRRLWTTGDEGLAERLVLDAAMGLGALSLVIFALGALQLYRFSGAICIVLALAGIAGVVCVVQEIRLSLGKDIPRTRSAARIVFAILLGLMLVAAMIPAMTPASMSDWDSLAYHLAVPKLYLEHGGIYRIDIMSHSHFPMLVEMLYIPGLALGITGAAKMVSFWITVLMVGAVAITAPRVVSGTPCPETGASGRRDRVSRSNAGLLAALAIAGMPIVLWEATTAYVDTAPALYTVFAVYFLLKYLDKPDRRSLAGCAVAAGFCASTKMTGLAIIPLLVIWLLADRYAAHGSRGERIWGREASCMDDAWRPKSFARASVALASVALLVALPWYLRSLVYTGNPVYPFFYSIFDGNGWSAELARRYTDQQAIFGMGHSARSLLLLPFDLTFFSAAFYDKPGLFVGPLMLAALPVLFLARYRSRKLVGLLLIFLAQVGIWFALTQQSRYLIPAFALLAILVAGLLYQDDRLRLARGAFLVVLVATSIFGVYTLVPQIASAAPYVFGTESQDDYLSRTIDVYPAEEFINTTLPPSAKIALYGDTRGFFLNKDYVWADPGHSVTYTREFASTAELSAFLKSQGVTHAQVNFSDWFPSRAKATGIHKLIYRAIEDGHFEPVYPEGESTSHVLVFEVK